MNEIDYLEYLTDDELRELDALLRAEKLAEDLSDPVRWIEKNFYVPELRGPLRLAEYQKRCLYRALSTSRVPARDTVNGGYVVDEDGNTVYEDQFNYSLIVWSDLKKSIKSTITAAVALWRAYCVSYGQIMIVANDLKQADSRVGHYIRRAIELNPEMRETIKVRPSGYLIELPNKTRIEAVPIDPTGEAGGNADMIVFSELWGGSNKAFQRMWTEATLSPTKFGKSFRWVESYAGFLGESVVLEQIYDNGVTSDDATRIWSDLDAYENKKARQFTLWNTRPRLAWQTAEYYDQERAILTPPEFNRVHRNEWQTSNSVFVPPEWIDACQVDDLSSFDENTPLVGALDAGTSSDNFGLVVVEVKAVEYEVGNNIVRVKKVIPRITKLWIPRAGEKLRFSDPIDKKTGKPIPENSLQPAPETVIRELSEKYHIVEWIYDPYQLHNLCTNLNADGVGYFSEMSQHSGGKRARADKNLYDIIRDNHLQLDQSEHADLIAHLKNANQKPEGEYMRLVKRNSNSKIDLAVCLSMAAFEAFELNLG